MIGIVIPCTDRPWAAEPLRRMLHPIYHFIGADIVTVGIDLDVFWARYVEPPIASAHIGVLRRVGLRELFPRSRYVAFIDSDDYHDPFRLKDEIERAAETDAHAIWHDTVSRFCLQTMRIRDYRYRDHPNNLVSALWRRDIAEGAAWGSAPQRTIYGADDNDTAVYGSLCSAAVVRECISGRRVVHTVGPDNASARPDGPWSHGSRAATALDLNGALMHAVRLNNWREKHGEEK